MIPHYLLAAVVCGFVVVLMPDTVIAQQRCVQPVAIFESVKNSVQLLQASTRAAQPAVRRQSVCPGETIQVGNNSRAVILILASNTPIQLDQNSEFVITPAQSGTGSLVELLRGALLFISRVRQSIEIRTPFVNAAIEGTEFVLRVQADRTVITVFEGAVRATNPLGTIVVGAGQQAVTQQGQAPVLEIPIRPRDAVQWALHYEPLLPSDSFNELLQVPEPQRGANFYLRSAALQLSAGQLEAARSDLDRLQQLEPSNGDADALRAIIAVALNDRATALASARTAVERSPRSAAARVALSYALQANFELDAALTAVTDAIDISPDNGLSWARLAELRLAQGDVGGAVQASQRAAQLAPNVSRAQTVLGFAALARFDTSDAMAAFERAIDLEPDSPLPRLGLGLAKIRRGRLADGRGDIELAAALNPESSLIRSYLGKAYFDEKRDSFAGESFTRAKSLDLFDPTPWLYDAIRKQATNQPVEALADIRESIRLNQNRAVYRSSLQLEADEAARGARLGRIYRDLGFEQLAINEAAKSLALDPADYSAHRFLADSYLTLPRHEIARDSELMQAQLLQPINIYPVQPRLADSGLVFLDEIAGSGVGFNEFTTLFARNQVHLVVDALGGGLGTRADNVIVSGIANRLSYSVGQFHYSTDGFRENNHETQNIANVFVQGELGINTGALVEVRVGDLKRGDRRMLFDPAAVLRRQLLKADSSSVRVGVRRNLSRRSVLIGSFVHGSIKDDLNTGDGFAIVADEDADFSEVRYIHDWQRANVTVGLGHYEGGSVESITLGALTLPPATLKTRHTNGYLYAGVAPFHPVTLVAGVSIDDFNGTIDVDKVNPKVGFTWAMGKGPTVRAASFRVLKRTVISSQTLEPTQVAGFNQFFEDGNSTSSRRDAVGIDQVLGRWASVGAEVSARDLAMPVRIAATGAVTETPSHERVHRAYAYLTPTSFLAITTQYQADRLRRDPRGRNPSFLADSRAHYTSVEARVFLKWGLAARVRASHVQQQGHFTNLRLVLFEGSDRFATLDGSLGYQLPRRFGTLSLDVRNATDESFRFQDRAPEASRFVPARLITLRCAVSF